ncbi:hypothetical protein [Azospirillum doebereinerae]|uniref:Quinol:cytochrome c oxidoreductase quinone-binding subunit 2 n=1 Tax=Azospirillum doebereinerae TaxID=92933 RepID=A0A433J4G5_9PROT|nr:hypothetical protein [Azospirillum doebereinerae]RUQ67123.1 hypothetical protein EJ913_20810 [Azospirillum doebereinerae]
MTAARWTGPALLLVAALAGALLAPRAALAAWLAALMVWVWPAVGALALLLIDGLFATGWNAAFRDALSRLTRLLPWLALGFLPVLAGMALLYPWVRGGGPSGWLAPGWFVARAVLVWGAWAGLGRFATVGRPRNRGAVAFALILLALSATVAAIDWMMSLEPGFVSAAYGLLLLSGGLLAACAAALPPALRASPDAPERSRGALGALLLALAMVWAYLAFMQYLVAWSGNRPALAGWYLLRGEGPWLWLLVGAVAAQAALPFLALLFPPVRSARRPLVALAGLILAGHALDTAWLVLPAFQEMWKAALPLAFVFTFGLGWMVLGGPVPGRVVRHGRA